MLPQASTARSGNDRYSSLLATTPASRTVWVVGSICAQRTQLTVPLPGLQAMVCDIHKYPSRYSVSRGRQSLPWISAVLPNWGWSTALPPLTPVALLRSNDPRRTRLLAPKGSSQDHTWKVVPLYCPEIM